MSEADRKTGPECQSALLKKQGKLFILWTYQLSRRVKDGEF